MSLSQEQLEQFKALAISALNPYVHFLELWQAENPGFLWCIAKDKERTVSCCISTKEPTMGEIFLVPDAVIWDTEGWRRVFANPELARYNIITRQGEKLVVRIPKGISEETFVKGLQALTREIFTKLQQLVQDCMLDLGINFSYIAL